MSWRTGDSLSTAAEAESVPTFRIQDTEFTANLDGAAGNVLPVRSSPRPYDVEFASERPLGQVIDQLVEEASHPVVLADRRALDAHLPDVPALADAATMAVDATEEFKSVDGALGVVDFMDSPTSQSKLIDGGDRGRYRPRRRSLRRLCV